MSIKRKKRKIENNYEKYVFRPKGIRVDELDEVKLTINELEALRLRYLEEKEQTEASKIMGISQSQYQRDMVKGLKKIVSALVDGRAIKIVDENDQ